MSAIADRKDTSVPVGTGIPGLDEILKGGLPPERIYLVEGAPGAGKTTLSLQFLLEGVRRNQPVLYITLSETRTEVEGVATSHGWSLEGVTLAEIRSGDASVENQYTLFHPSEVELGETIRRILVEIERVKPTRLVIDSLSELRLMAQSPLHYRRQVAALKEAFTSARSTALLLDQQSLDDLYQQIQSIAHGIIVLEQLSPEYGAERRRLRVMKLRGLKYAGGYHDCVIQRGGVRVFPRLVAAEHHNGFADALVTSGVGEIDQLTGGGLPAGTSTLLIGPAGSGKSTLASQFAIATCRRGEHVAYFAFDESLSTMLARCKGLGINLQEHLDAGRITVQQVDPGELSPGEFVHEVRRQVETRKCRIVVIDSLNGYLNAMPNERFLMIQLHELLTYLGQRGVLTFLVLGQLGLVAAAPEVPVETSYLADNVILFHYFEALGEVRQAISVLKKRGGAHERSVRELKLGSHGICVGPPLREFQGVLTSAPRFLGNAPEMLQRGHESEG